MENSLFKKENVNSKNIPLAEKMRPQKLDSFYGQQKILGENSLLRKMIENDNFSSLILWGPPGSGKTSLVNIIKNRTKKRFISISAVLSGVKEVKQIIKDAEIALLDDKTQTLLFIDEIHRFNKAQQDIFLPFVENGIIIILGATTENPSFEIINPLLSRSQVFITEKLELKDLNVILTNSLKKLNFNGLTTEILNYLSSTSGGDARKALNKLDLIHRHLFNKKNIELKDVKKILNDNVMIYDKNGEEHYNLISALHKSIRGSDPQAGIYWMARMLESGEDPKYIVRRLIRLATEDIGLADPNALVQAIATKDAIDFIGMPECNTALTQLVVYLATAPKSNSTEIAYLKAKKDVYKTFSYEVPFYIRNAPTKLMEEKGYGEGYKYSHDYKYHYSYQKYFPKKMIEKKYYEPSDFGYEKEISKRLTWWEKLKANEKDRKK